MRKIFFNLVVIIFLLIPTSFSQKDSIRSIIVMIPDGTSMSVLSLARWYKTFTTGEPTSLHVDPWLCGLVKTHSSNAPIGDSAPTTSCYMTGYLSQTGFISTYPPKTEQDLTPIDENRAYQPLITLMEAARIKLKKSIGLVFTSYLMDATPADCAAHSYNRKYRDAIAKQMVHNQIDVVIGGGSQPIIPYVDFLKEEGYDVILDNIDEFRHSKNPLTWAFFGNTEMPYNIDRDTAEVPSLAEMTAVALKKLSTNPNGFFLMVEGSKIDWAAHNNDTKTIIYEFLAFDEAVEVAINFAKNDKQTLVVILPDHGNSGIALGNTNSNKGYDKLSLTQIIEPITHHSVSAANMADILAKSQPEEIPQLFKKYYQIDISNEQQKEIADALHYHLNKNISTEEKKVSLSLEKTITKIVNSNLYIGYTTYGHTGEDVFLALYHPYKQIQCGLITNVEVHHFLREALHLENSIDSLTNECFVPHQLLFQSASQLKIDSINPSTVQLHAVVGKSKIVVESYDNFIKINNQPIKLSSVPIYVDKNRTFYLPREILRYLP
ncbi:MAG TPA: alkaline phosphatase [Bacteroidales bacterium]|nr:alkaline phosphatase [Bacteroidales bacterium]